jgi:hypothetical protein
VPESIQFETYTAANELLHQFWIFYNTKLLINNLKSYTKLTDFQ